MINGLPIESFIIVFFILWLSSLTECKTVLYTVLIFSTIASFSIVSIPTEHFITGSFFVCILIVFFSLLTIDFNSGIVGGTTAPAFGFGIFPIGPRILPKYFAISGIRLAWAIKKSIFFARFFRIFWCS